MSGVKLTKAQVRNRARDYVASLLAQEQIPASEDLSEEDGALFMEEMNRISGRVRASITPSGLQALGGSKP